MIKTGTQYFIAFILLMVGCYFNLQAQSGQRDTAFFKGLGIERAVIDGLELSDGKLIISGDFTYVNHRLIQGLAKLLPDGNTDYTFNPNGTGANNVVYVVAKQSTGKIIIGGDFTTYNGVATNHLARIGADGFKDVSFTGSVNLRVAAIYVDNDDKILIGGNFTTLNSASANRFVRLNSDGSRDTTFIIGTGFNGDVYRIDKQSSGKYIVSGAFSAYNGVAVNRIARINANGTIDTSFNIGTGPNNIVGDIAVGADDKIYVSGTFTIFNSETVNRIIRLNNDGGKDTTFITGTGLNGQVYEFYLDSDKKAVLVGNFTSYNGQSVPRIIRLDTTGTRDSTFIAGTGFNAVAHHIQKCADGKYLAFGEFAFYNGNVRLSAAKFSSNGSISQEFLPNQLDNTAILDMGVQSDGRVIVVGQFTKYKDRTINYIARLNIDGTFDTTFLSGSGANSNIWALAIQPDDKILIAGQFTSFNGNARNRMLRLNPDGSIDSTFSIGTGFNNTVRKIILDKGGRIYVGGAFNSYQSISCARVIRLLPNGARDPYFTTSINDNTVSRLLLRKNGKLIASGNFINAGGKTCYGIVQLDTTGVVDSTFINGQGFSALNSGDVPMIEQSDGKIIIGFNGDKTIDGVSKSRIARLNVDGSLDNSYNIDNTAITSGIVSNMVSYNDGVIAVGSFTVSNTTGHYIKYLTKDGIYNTDDFKVGGAAEGSLHTIYYDGYYGRILLGGNIVAYQQVYAHNLVALYNMIDSVKTDSTLCAGGLTMVHFQKRFTFNSGNIFTVQLSDSLGSFASPVVIGIDTVDGWGVDSIPIAIPMYKGNGTGYRVRVISTSPVFTSAGSNLFTIGPISAPTIVGDTIFCTGDTVILSANGADTYNWSTGTTTSSIHIMNGGVYSLTVTENNCTASASKTMTEIIPDSLLVVHPYALMGRSDTCYGFSLDSFGISTDSMEWSLASGFDTTITVATGDSIRLCVSAGTVDTIWFRPYVSGPGCKGNISHIVLRAIPYPIEVIKLSDLGTIQEVHVSDRLKFMVPGYTYAQSDSVDFYYKITDGEGATVAATASVGYSLDGHYEIGPLSALTVGEKYKLDLILYNGNRYSFVLIRN